MCWLLTENYVLNANALVFMLIHNELFSNVCGLDLGLSLIHCGLGLGLKKNFWASASSSASLFLASASALASCPAGLVNIPGVNELVVSPGPTGLRDGHESAGGQPSLVHLAEQLLALVRADVVEKLQHQDQVHRLIQTFTHTQLMAGMSPLPGGR